MVYANQAWWWSARPLHGAVYFKASSDLALRRTVASTERIYITVQSVNHMLQSKHVVRGDVKQDELNARGHGVLTPGKKRRHRVFVIILTILR